jgi:hypothetical protein
MEQFMQILTPVIEALLGKFGILVQIVTVIGSLRLILKPTMSYIQGIVALTPTKKDNEFLDKVLASPIYKAVSYMLDWFASLKLPKKGA